MRTAFSTLVLAALLAGAAAQSPIVDEGTTSEALPDDDYAYSTFTEISAPPDTPSPVIAGETTQGPGTADETPPPMGESTTLPPMSETAPPSMGGTEISLPETPSPSAAATPGVTPDGTTDGTPAPSPAATGATDDMDETPAPSFSEEGVTDGDDEDTADGDGAEVDAEAAGAASIMARKGGGGVVVAAAAWGGALAVGALGASALGLF
ncbi:unnamed protein product [Ectocarpus sp. 12 AP-2014]